MDRDNVFEFPPINFFFAGTPDDSRDDARSKWYLDYIAGCEDHILGNSIIVGPPKRERY